MPVEIAIRHYDPVIFLLAGLGASLDVGIKQSYESSWSRKASLLEAVEAIIKNLGTGSEGPKQPAGTESMDVDNANQPEWKAWIAKSNKATKDFQKTIKWQQNNERINEHARMKDYLEEVLGLLKEKKAKTWNQLHPEAEKKEEDPDDGARVQQKQAVFFEVWSTNWWAGSIPQEKVPLYEELYEACWNGDDEKIRELCLPPPEGTTRKVAPIQIVCKTNEGGEPVLARHLFFSTPTPLFIGYTPLHVAIHSRHWSTANTVLTIAAAQQKIKPETAPRADFNTLDIEIGPLVSFFHL